MSQGRSVAGKGLFLPASKFWESQRNTTDKDRPLFSIKLGSRLVTEARRHSTQGANEMIRVVRFRVSGYRTGSRGACLSLVISLVGVL
jgi:hypothetical protein